MYNLPRKSESNANKAKEADKKLVDEFIIEYKKIYKRNCCRMDADKFWLLSLQIRTLLIMMLLEKVIQNKIYLRDVGYLLKYNISEKFRTDIQKLIIPEFTLENMFFACDYVGVTFNELKKRALEDILINLGEQRDKNEYEKFNKLYSNN